AREISGVRTMRAQNCAARIPAGAIVPAKPLGTVSLGQPRRFMAGHRARSAFGLRFRNADASPRRGLRVHRAGGIGRVSLHAGRAFACLSHAECRWFLGVFGTRVAAAGGVRNRFAGCLRDGFAGSSRNLFWNRSGKLYASKDEGKGWKKIMEGLPQIVSVQTAVILLDGGPPERARLKENPGARR